MTEIIQGPLGTHSSFEALPGTPVSSSVTSTKWVHSFGLPSTSTTSSRDLLGGKGAGLVEMSSLGLPVPPGFILSTSVCSHFTNHGTYPSDLRTQVRTALQELQKATGTGFVSSPTLGKMPLLLSVRSGAPVSMPGMMDTVLNLGLNDSTVETLASFSNDERFALDSYRRLIAMFGNVVCGIDGARFESVLDARKRRYDVKNDADLSILHLRSVLTDFKTVFKEETGEAFPQDVHVQLWRAIAAVFKSWSNDRAVVYRRLNSISDSLGTAVTVQAMVFGNMGAQCATGVAFTRNPSTGENELYGEFLCNAQGEDVVAGVRTPQPIVKHGDKGTSMEEVLPQSYQELCRMRNILEGHYRDVQDLEFTVQKGKLFLLQTRTAKRSARAAVKIAMDMATSEKVLSIEEALERVDPHSLSQLLHRGLHPDADRKVITKGMAASPGAAVGTIALSAEEAQKIAGNGGKSILVRDETSAEDVHGMAVSAGILTRRGGMTSHAAVVARGMGRPAVTGASSLLINMSARTVKVGTVLMSEGDTITIDGGTGEVMLGEVETIEPEMTAGGNLDTILTWADQMASLTVLANADTPKDVARARAFGARGVGLCRTEHMFFDPSRLLAVREMILASDGAGRAKALERILPMQRVDFESIFTVMKGLPVTVRLLDPPLHEFLPREEKEMGEVAQAVGVDVNVVKARVKAMKEDNPMLGLRGCRVGIMFPEVYEMQVRAILEAAVSVAEEIEGDVKVDIMVPFISTETEIEIMKSMIDGVAGNVIPGRWKENVCYRVGTMIELPRAALRAGDIARHAEFFSFGTNDMTQTAFGLSRDDAISFLPAYKTRGILCQDPFVSLDQDGVGELMQIAVERGRATRKDLKLCLCGEQGADPGSVSFCDRIGLHAVSCSPFQVPVARLAAAQAAILRKREEMLSE